MKITPPPIQMLGPKRPPSNFQLLQSDLRLDFMLRKYNPKPRRLILLICCLLGLVVGFVWGYLEVHTFSKPIIGRVLIGLFTGLFLSRIVILWLNAYDRRNG